MEHMTRRTYLSSAATGAAAAAMSAVVCCKSFQLAWEEWCQVQVCGLFICEQLSICVEERKRKRKRRISSHQAWIVPTMLKWQVLWTHLP